MATADAAGKWSVVLDLRHVGPGPFELMAEGAHGRAVAADVLVGEVWLCSGQSNMELALANSKDGAAEAARSANPRLRQFLVEKASALSPLETIKGKWTVAGPKTSRLFTAVGYYFGKKIQMATHAPVGLIHASWDGTPAEAWTSVEGFATDPALQEAAEKAQREYADFEQFKTAYHAWLVQTGHQDHPRNDPTPFTDRAGPGTGWKTLTLPGTFADAGLPDAGAAWVQRIVTLAEGGAGRGVDLYLGDIHGGVEVYWNGKKLGSNEYGGVSTHYRARGADVLAGDNVLVLRIFQPVGGAGIVPGPAAFRADHQDGSLPLAGPWLGKAEFALPALSPGQEPPAKPPTTRPPQEVAGFLYNGMIAPLVPCALRGVIWYQGEANTSRAWQYRTTFPRLIEDWRARWGRGNFPFYFCQLAGCQTRQAQPGESAWAELREAQTLALALPGTGEAVLIDAGEENDIHPKDKVTPGERLARLALAKDYGQTGTAWSGPVLDGFRVDGNSVRLTFRHADGGLVAAPLPQTYRPSSLLPETKPVVRRSPGGALEGFAVCGVDRQWKWATTAAIEGDGVVVTCTDVRVPVAVRYAWGDDPLCNLGNGAGLPAGPFRTDDFPATTREEKY